MEHRFDTRLRELPSAVLHELAGRIGAVDECRGWWQGRGQAPPPVLERLRRQALARSAGAAIPFSEPRPPQPPRRSPWERGSPGRRPGSSPPASGYAELLRSVFDGHREMEFGKDLILRFHERLSRSSPAGGTARGQYRTLPIRPPAFLHSGMESPALRPTDPHLVPREMDVLIGWTALRLASPPVFHPLLVIPAFLLEFLAIRPFASENLRMSRVLAAFLLLKSGYGYVPYVSLDKAIADREMEYAIALRRAQARRNLPRPDISSWILAFLDVLRAQAGELRLLLEDRPREELLSGNQRAVLELFGRHRELSVRQVRRELGIPRDTVKQVLRRLCELDLARRAGAGRAARYLRNPPSAG